MNQRVEEKKQMQVNLFPLLGLPLFRQRDMCHCQPQGKKQRVHAKEKPETLSATSPSLIARDYLDTSICDYFLARVPRHEPAPKPSLW
jgi:hypothetical protein